jgi:hypothetical protein
MRTSHAVLWADGRSVILAHRESHMLDDMASIGRSVAWPSGQRQLRVPRSGRIVGDIATRVRTCSRPELFGDGVKGKAMSACPSVESLRATEGPFTKIV